MKHKQFIAKLTKPKAILIFYRKGGDADENVFTPNFYSKAFPKRLFLKNAGE